ncbi:MAG: helix-turn-helix domain-containing protein [Clostridium sp.]
MVKNRLKEIRMREYVLDSGEFAKLIGTDIKNYSNWERGISKPNLEKALMIAKKLNKSIHQIWYLDF